MTAVNERRHTISGKPRAKKGEPRPFWASWWATAYTFCYHGPWWISGERMSDDAQSICAAVMATSAANARRIIANTHNYPDKRIEFRFTNEREPEWSPFCERFARTAWMKWPWPVKP